MEYPTDNCESILGRQLIYARSWWNLGNGAVYVLWTSVGTVLVLDYLSRYGAFDFFIAARLVNGSFPTVGQAVHGLSISLRQWECLTETS